MNLVTVDMLLERSKVLKNKEKKIKIEVFELGGIIEFNIPTRDEVLEVFSSSSEDMDSEIVYNNCELFKDNKLQTALSCMEPFEVVPKVLEARTIRAIAETLLEKAGFSKNIPETIKVIGEDVKN